MRVLRWIPLIVAVIAIYYLANSARQIKDAVVEQAPSRLGIRAEDWKHWSAIADQIQDGHIPDITEKDWRDLKSLCDSAGSEYREGSVKVLGLLKDTPYRDQAIALSQKLTKDGSEWVRKQAIENLKQLGPKDGQNLPSSPK